EGGGPAWPAAPAEWLRASLYHCGRSSHDNRRRRLCQAAVVAFLSRLLGLAVTPSSMSTLAPPLTAGTGIAPGSLIVSSLSRTFRKIRLTRADNCLGGRVLPL